MRPIPVKYQVEGPSGGMFEGACIHLYNDGFNCFAVVVGKDGEAFCRLANKLTFPKPTEYDYFGDNEIRKGGVPFLELPKRLQGG